MQVERQLLRPQMKLRAGGRRAYMNQEPDDLPSKEEKQTQTELGLVSTGKTRFVTPRLVLGSDEATNKPFAKAFADLSEHIRSAEWKSSLLVVLGHDLEKRRDELERKIREDEASEAIDGELRAFFNTVLAPLIQERETALVNTIHECVQEEIQSQQQVIQSHQQRLTQLTQQIKDWEKQVVHLKGKVDRRVAENNALRKEQYKQLLMLRDIMSKQGAEPGALSALNEAIATVLAGKQKVPAPETTLSNNEQDQPKNPGRSLTALNANTQVLHREKEKWEHRAREATLECQELRDKIARLTQENMTYRASEAAPWFLKPEQAIAERQRIADAVGSCKSNWEDIGDSLVELLNNDILWTAVEQSARRGGKRRVARGLEAVLTQIDNPSIEEDAASEKGEEPGISQLGKRHSTFVELGRLIPCRACDGVGYIHADRGDDGTNDSDSYLRKTLEQVLELKTQLEKTNTTSLKLEGQLQLSHMHAAQLEEKIHQAELVKSTAIDSCLQTDLDEEEGLDLDEIMRSAYGQESSPTEIRRVGSRQNRRNLQYEHLIVELKSTLAVKDEGLVESRKALDVAQARTVTLQRALQKEKDTHTQELTMLNTSLAFSLKSRNSKIEERQAAVKLLMKKFPKKSSVVGLPSMNESEHDEENASDNDKETNDNVELVTTNTSEQGDDQNKRMEALVQRYAEDIVRVRKEHDTQQELLKKAEADIVEEDAERSRTNSISQGNLVVSLASHPRDLFKALSTAQTDMLKLRRASQRSSALQTDRLLTLTTHLGHMSEELCTLRKRNLAELEFWKLECEKLQNTNKALEAEPQIYQKQLQEARNNEEFENISGTCSMCEKHKKRLMQISNELLNQTQGSQADPEVEVPALSALTESERKLVSTALLDLESIYTGMPAVKQQLARELVVNHLGNALIPRSSSRRTTIDLAKSPSKSMRTGNQGGRDGGSPMATRSADSSPRKSFTPVKSSKFSRQLKKDEYPDTKVQKPTQSPTRASVDLAAPPTNTTCSETDQTAAYTGESASSTSQEKVSETYQRKTLVKEILVGSGLLLTKHDSAIDKSPPEVREMKIDLENNSESGPDNNAESNTNSPVVHVHNKVLECNEYEPQDDSSFDDEKGLALEVEELPLMNASSDIQRDPEVILQLRRLINESAEAKTRVGVGRWEILVCRILFLTGEHRLEQLKLLADRRSKIHSDGFLRPACLKIINTCDVMIKIVQQRKIALATAVSVHECSRRDLKKAQAQLIHSVAMLLDNLNRKGKPKIELRELLYPSQGGSPRRSPTNNRPLYPATKVHMNHLPQTQQIPTSTFPAIAATHSNDQVRPSSSRSTNGLSHDEGYVLPHRLVKSAGPNPFNLVHSSIGALRGSIHFPDPTYIQSYRESEGSLATNSPSGPQRPVRPHSSPAGPRFMSPRAFDLVSSASSLYKPEQIDESDTETVANFTCI